MGSAVIDTPPGVALMFELWSNRSSGQYSVRAYFTAQTLEQMRASTPLTASNPPERMAVFIPSCSHADTSCPLASFLRILEQASGTAVVPDRQLP
jgi:4-phytase/acid phosphatase